MRPKKSIPIWKLSAPEAREWLEKNFPPSLKGKQGFMIGEGGPPSGDDFAKWKRAMGEKGWGTPTYPKQYGGGGLSSAQVRVLQQEMNRLGAWNPIGGMGVMMFGPTLLEYGNEEQKKKYVPGIVQGTTWWCQGYSEPGAGSDLAALRTQAVTRAITSSSTARRSGPAARNTPTCASAWCAPTTARSTRAISFLLIDMKDPGVESARSS